MAGANVEPEIAALAERFSAALGPVAGQTWALYKFRADRGLPLPIRIEFTPRGVLHSIVIRTRPHSDEEVVDQIFIEQQYRCLDQLCPATILDLGANVGCSSVWFISRFANARIVAVEPDPLNFEVLKQNCAPYPHIIPILGAAWSESCRLALLRGKYRDGRDWTTQVELAEDGDVEGFDIPSLAEHLGTKRIDLLKIDIERAEIELFGHSAEAWLPSVRNICIELHDRECETVFFSALSGYDYDLSQSGELTLCNNLRPKA